MRGKGTSASPVGGGGGITPAHAGKSFHIVMNFLTRQDHPRTCGEKLTKNPNMVTPQGSPPHMRGKGKVNFCIGELYRITPAHAGKRNYLLKLCMVCQDHPRTCGEKFKKI